MTVRNSEVITCNSCGKGSFHFFESRDYKITQCLNKKCKAVRDLTALAEDVKHIIYHESGEPSHNNDV